MFVESADFLQSFEIKVMMIPEEIAVLHSNGNQYKTRNCH